MRDTIAHIGNHSGASKSAAHPDYCVGCYSSRLPRFLKAPLMSPSILSKRYDESTHLHL